MFQVTNPVRGNTTKADIASRPAILRQAKRPSPRSRQGVISGNERYLMGAVNLVQLPLGVNSIWAKCARFGMDRFWADRRGPLALSLVAPPDPWLAWKNLEMPILSSRQTSINNPPF